MSPALKWQENDQKSYKSQINSCKICKPIQEKVANKFMQKLHINS